jgi:hypothetical protein
VPASDVIAMTIGDIHLSHVAPVSRSAEPDWYAAMRRPLRELKRLLFQHHNPPVLIPGDIFDDGWRVRRIPPELINFALQELPDNMYTVPGNHDLPHHRLDQVHRSAYWTLVEAGKALSLAPSQPVDASGARIWGFPHGTEIKPAEGRHSLALAIAVSHCYIWRKGYGYEGAPEECLTQAFHSRLQGFDVAVFGDNHKGFQTTIKRAGGHVTTIFNVGTFMRRTSTEREYQPVVGLIHQNGTVTRHPLDTTQDKFVEVDPKQVPQLERAGEFLSRLEQLRDAKINLTQAMQAYFRAHKVDEAVKEIIVGAMAVRKGA